MKKLIILLIIIVSVSYGQNTGVPGKDFFPQIGFFDFIVNYSDLILSESGLTELKNFQD